MQTIFNERACRVCGCTQNLACGGGCWWVADDLCSACAAVEQLRDEILITGEVRKMLGLSTNKDVIELVKKGRLPLLKETPTGFLFLQSAVEKYMEKALIHQCQKRGRIPCHT